MPDAANPFALNQQEALLREIRDELKTSRQVGATGSSGGSRPSPGFIQAQHTADRMIAGEWAQMGWANAYSSQIKSSLANDMMGAMGLRAAPQSMWQREYETMSKSMLADRLSSFPADLLMPGFGRRSRDMGAQLYQLSSRFGRAGDNVESNFHASMTMGRELQVGAASDMRLSGQDYSSILSHSANAGQFDFASGTGDVKAIFGELKSAVADLTKSLRVGAGEVAQTMGAFRQFGMVDVADQRRSAELMGASARVAGVSTPEMAAIARAGMESGAQYGLGAGGSAQLAQNLAMAARSGSRSGLISGSLMAAAGGVQGMTQSQQAAIDRFTNTPEAYYAQLGLDAGGQGGALANLMTGISATGGTLGGFVRADALRQERMSGLTAAQRQAGFNRSIEQGMASVGVDPMGADAYGYAYSMLRGQMGDAAGLAYAKQNWTQEGRAQGWGNQMREQQALAGQGRQRDEQLRFENESFMGRFRQTTAAPGAMMGEFGLWTGRKMDQVGQWTGLSKTSFEVASEAMNIAGGDALTMRGAMDATIRSSQHANMAESRVKLARSVSTFQALATSGMSIAGTAAGAYIGGTAGAAAGTVVGGPVIGTGVGLVAGTIGGGLAGKTAGEATANWLFGFHDTPELKGFAADDYKLAFRGMTGGLSSTVANLSDGQKAQKLEILSSNASFRAMTGVRGRGKMSDDESAEFARHAAAAATALGDGYTAEDVVGFARSIGVEGSMAESGNVAAQRASAGEISIKNVTAGVESTGASLAGAETASAISALARAGKNIVKQNAAEKRLTALGIAGSNLDKLKSNLADMDGGDRLELSVNAAAYASGRMDDAARQRFTAFNALANESVGKMKDMGEGAVKRLGDLTSETHPEALMKMLMEGQEGDSDSILRQRLIANDRSGTLQKIANVGQMDDLMDEAKNETFSKQTGLSPADLTEARARARSAAPGDVKAQTAFMKSAAALTISGGSAAVKQASDPVHIAGNNMILAASILKQIASDLGVKSATGTTP